MTGSNTLRVLSSLLRPQFSLLAGNVAVIAWAGYLAVTAPDDFRGPYVVLLLLQAFAASSGYAARARRGHFDQLLAGQPTRYFFAAAHAFASVGTGLAAWLIVCLLDALGGGLHWPLGLTSRALAAVVYISAVAWACSAPFSRYTAGVVWLLATILLAGSGRLLDLRMSYAVATTTWDGLRHALPAVLVFPPFLIGEPAAPPGIVTGAVLAIASAAAAAGIAFITRVDVPLEDAE